MIGVSYISGDGGAEDFAIDGVPSAGSHAASLLGLRRADLGALPGAFSPTVMKTGMGENEEAKDEKVKLSPSDSSPGYLNEKLDSRGSIEASFGGLRLKGDVSASGSEPTIYSIVGSTRKFRSLREVDPKEGGALVGRDGAGSEEPDNTAVSSIRKDGFKFPVLTRYEIKCEDVAQTGGKMYTFYEFRRIVSVSQAGRIVGLSGEKRRIIQVIDVMPSEVAAVSGKYEVRPFWLDTSTDKPTLAMLAFGTGTDLDTWDGLKFTANDDPQVDPDTGETIYPVKMVGVSTCTYGVANPGGGA